uniref:PARP catalytic domain-containing protein n=1 Tax=Monopterus albus TaxID=43700 RepID=A0A3Q3JMC1_MONAL
MSHFTSLVNLKHRIQTSEAGRGNTESDQSFVYYLMYHGTTRKNVRSILVDGFHQSEDGMLGRGVYLSRDLQKASRYPLGHSEDDRVIIKVKVDVGKVIAITYQGHPLYDTAWVPPNCGMVESNLEENCVWDRKRIKIIGLNFPKPTPALTAFGLRS